MVKILPYNELPTSFYEDRVDNLFYSTAWLQVLQQTYGYKWFTALDTNTDQFILFTVIDNLAGKKVMSLPFSDYTPINANYRESLVTIAETLRRQYPEHQIIFKTELAADDPIASSLGAPTRHAYYHRIPVAEPKKIEVSSSFRRGVKKAEKGEVTTKICTDEASLRTFYKIYHQLRFQKFSSIPQPYAFFRSIYQAFIVLGNGFILDARWQGEVVASAIILQHRNTLYYKFGSSNPTALEHRPNNLLFYRLTEIAMEKKCSAIDLGLSGAGASYEGLVRFKESMGGVRHPITYFTSTPDNYDERPEKELKATLSSITKTMVGQQLSVEATSELSATLYPYFA